TLLEGLHHGGAAVGLHREDPRERAREPAHRAELLVALRDPEEPGAAARRIEEDVGHPPVEVGGELETDRLLTLEAVRLLERRQVEPAERSEEHTSELQSRFDLVCRLLL